MAYNYDNFEQALAAFMVDEQKSHTRTESEIAASIQAMADAGKLSDFLKARRGVE